MCERGRLGRLGTARVAQVRMAVLSLDAASSSLGTIDRDYHVPRGP
jgi:hypothetical protein